MLFNIFKKQRKKDTKVYLLKTLISWLDIDQKQKDLYLDSLGVLQETELDRLYIEITKFIEDVEIKKIEKIKKDNFSSPARKKELEEKKKEINSVNFLLNNL